MWLDHVIMAASDAGATAARIEATHGLRAVQGTTMHALGLRSLYVPFGNSFIEIIGIADEDLSRTTNEGRYIHHCLDIGRRWVSWCIATDDLEPLLKRTGWEAIEGFTVTDGGEEYAWRITSPNVTLTDPGLPFFLEWTHPDRYPGRTPSARQIDGMRLAWLEVAVDETRLKSWVGETLPWVRIVDDEEGVRGVGISTPDGDIVLR